MEVIQNQQRTWTSQLGPFFDQPPESQREDHGGLSSNVPSSSGPSSNVPSSNVPSSSGQNYHEPSSNEPSSNEPSASGVNSNDSVLVILSDSSTTDAEEDEEQDVIMVEDNNEESEEDDDDDDDEPIITGVQQNSRRRLQRELLPRSVNLIPGYRSLNRDKQKRAERAMTQRMLILSRETLDDYCEEFEVIGTVGSAYNVTIGQRMSCSCIDFDTQFSHCKHILMILLKVYRLDFTSPLYRSLSANSEQRRDAIMNAAPDPSVFVSDTVRERINNVLYQTSTSTNTNTNTARVQQHQLDHSDCAICFDPFNQNERENVDYCWTCGNNVHKQCMERWIRTRRGVNETNATCIYCKSRWHPPSGQDGPRRRDIVELDAQHVDEYGYVNVAAEAGLSRHRPDWPPSYSGRRRSRYEYESECDCDCCDHSGYYY